MSTAGNAVPKLLQSTKYEVQKYQAQSERYTKVQSTKSFLVCCGANCTATVNADISASAASDAVPTALLLALAAQVAAVLVAERAVCNACTCTLVYATTNNAVQCTRCFCKHC